MSNNKIKFATTRRDLLKLGSGVLIGSMFTGCGGGNSALHGVTGSQNASTRSGRVKLTIVWPKSQGKAATGRYIPPYAQSLFFEMYPQGNPAMRYSLVANRPADLPSTQAVEFDELFPVGAYVLAGVARVLPNGQGGTVASASTLVNVQADVVTTVNLTLNSTIKSIQVLGQPLTLLVGASLNLSGQALDPDGNLVVVPTGALQWKIMSGSDVVSISADGVLKGLALGTAQIQLVEPDAGITSAPATVSIVIERNPDVVWVSSGSELGFLNVLQGAYTRVGTVQDSNQAYSLNDLAWSSGNTPQLYGISSGNQLVLIDSMTAQATAIGLVTLNGNGIENLTGLTFRSDGRLYAGGNNQGLYLVDPATAKATLIGQMPAASAGDIAFSPDDQLYLASSPAGIWHISPDTATGQQVSDSGGHVFYGIAFTGGKLFGFSTDFIGSNYSIVQIDTTTGATTVIRVQPDSLGLVGGASNAPR